MCPSIRNLHKRNSGRERSWSTWLYKDTLTLGKDCVVFVGLLFQLPGWVLEKFVGKRRLTVFGLRKAYYPQNRKMADFVHKIFMKWWRKTQAINTLLSNKSLSCLMLRPLSDRPCVCSILVYHGFVWLIKAHLYMYNGTAFVVHW